jgi:hypothetical protein
MKILFIIEELISNGTVSAKEGEEAMARMRKMITAEVLYKASKNELIEAYNGFVKRMEDMIPVKEHRQIIINAAKDILEFLTADSVIERRLSVQGITRSAWSMTP